MQFPSLFGSYSFSRPDSTCVDHVRGNGTVMHMAFKSNPSKEYTFWGVPTQLANTWQGASSAGKFYHANIKQYSDNYRG